MYTSAANALSCLSYVQECRQKLRQPRYDDSQSRNKKTMFHLVGPHERMGLRCTREGVLFLTPAREKGSHSRPRRFRVFVLLCPAGRRSPPLLNMSTTTTVPFHIWNAFRFPFGTRSVSHSERVPYPIWNAFRLSVWNNQIFQMERVAFWGSVSEF